MLKILRIITLLKDGYFLAEGYITEIPLLVFFYSLLIPAAFPLSILSMEVYSRAIRTTAHVGGAVSSLSRCRADPASAATSERALSDSCADGVPASSLTTIFIICCRTCHSGLLEGLLVNVTSIQGIYLVLRVLIDRSLPYFTLFPLGPSV